MFHLLPIETLKYLFSFAPVCHFPLRQVCRLFREVIPPLTLSKYRDLLYEAGDVALIEHYKLPCSQHNFETILRRGHEKLFEREENKIYFCSAQACVQGRNEYIIKQLLNRGHVSRTALLYEACRQNHLDLAKRMHREESELCVCTGEAVQGAALEVLVWIVARDTSYYNLILQAAIHYRQTKVLRWLPQRQLRKISKRDLFVKACSSTNMDLFNFLLEIDYVSKQTITMSLRLAESSHVQMIRIAVLQKGWVLCEEMFDAALELGCEEMLSCLLELGCPHEEREALYQTVGEKNIPWLIRNLPLPEDSLLDVCRNGPEDVLFHLVRQGCLPDSFIDDPEITLAALQKGFIRAVEEYLQQGYVFYSDVCLQVENRTSLEWLIENNAILCPELCYRLVREMDVFLLQKIEHLVDFPPNLLDYTFALMEESYDSKLEKIAQWIQAE
ncbi:hypothetical protein [Cedratvirus kamchatka]|uniref:Ankyrin repeat-containing protein n=1 Tax=Cedratvirus kamchatka TaxID=2716914 RepID=A0A6G8MYP6_9VIRU|nr:hypothetical protein [Cedratvirus kamchatka]